MTEQKTSIDTTNERQMNEVEARCSRHYKASPLPVFRDDSTAPPRKEELLALYGEICNSWRMLTDVRFKLLGFVPTVSVVVLANILSRDEPTKGLSAIVRIGIIVFGFLITLAVYVYDSRNSQFYDDLISRGRRIEEELGIDTGQFRGRLKPSNHLIQHDVATNLIYGTAMAGWLFALLATWLGWTMWTA